MTDRTYEYTFNSLDELAQHLDKLAKSQRDGIGGKTSKMQAAMKREWAVALESAADIIRHTRIVELKRTRG